MTHSAEETVIWVVETAYAGANSESPSFADAAPVSVVEETGVTTVDFELVDRVCGAMVFVVGATVKRVLCICVMLEVIGLVEYSKELSTIIDNNTIVTINKYRYFRVFSHLN